MEKFAESFEAYFEKNRKILEESLMSFLRDKVEAQEIDVAKYIIEGGKRLRGLLTLYFAELIGGSFKNALKAAVALELVHSCSLAIDDIIDLDTKRRGKDAAWVAKGLAKTVLVSNLLIPLAIKEVEYLGDDAVKNVIETWLKITKGEINDVFNSEATYLEIIEYKTSSLFQLSLILGAIAANRKDLIGISEKFGLYLGYLYQISDDLIDSKFYINSSEKPPFLSKMLKWLGINDNQNLNWEMLKEVVFKKLNFYYKKIVEMTSTLEDVNMATTFNQIAIYIVQKILSEGGLLWKPTL